MSLPILGQPQQSAAPFNGSNNGADSKSTAPMPSTTSNTPSTMSDNKIICHWNACNQKFITPELLYEHICKRHVGRKSNNSPNLTCQWNLCRTTTMKRDHMISHIRVHVALKPHTCKFCRKSFKRPQDLKKHAKAHANDPVRRPQEPQSRPDSKLQLPGDMSQLNSPSRPWLSAFPSPEAKSPLDYVYHTGYPSYHYTPQPSTSHGLYFTQRPPKNPHMEHPGYGAAPRGDDRKRIFDAVDASFGSAKRREINPSSCAMIDSSPMALPSSFPIYNNLNSQLADPAEVHGSPASNPKPVGAPVLYAHAQRHYPGGSHPNRQPHRQDARHHFNPSHVTSVPHS